jgi:hypothetical protein
VGGSGPIESPGVAAAPSSGVAEKKGELTLRRNRSRVSSGGNQATPKLKVARRLGAEESASIIELAIQDLEDAKRSNEILSAEAIAASAYWPAWWDLPMRFVKADLPNVPELWTTVGPRRSPRSQSARSAVTPANALLVASLVYDLVIGSR